MNNLLLLAALGAGYVYFTKPKTTTKKSTKTPKTETPPKNGKLTAGLKENGYEIYDCKKLIIYDAQKAYDYAFNVGANTKELNGQFGDILFGNCFEDIKDLNNLKIMIDSVEKSKFVFNLLKYAFSGYLTNHADEKDELIESLKKIKEKLVDYLGFNDSDFNLGLIIQDIKLPLERGFTITNCNTFQVTDSVKMKAYMDATMLSVFESLNYKEKDMDSPESPFHFSVQFLKQVAPECYDQLISYTMSKDAFIISYMFIAVSFSAFIAFRYLVKDGIFAPDNWKESFNSLEDWTIYTTTANEILANWAKDLYVKFGLDDTQMKDLFEQIQKSGKYPIE